MIKQSGTAVNVEYGTDPIAKLGISSSAFFPLTDAPVSYKVQGLYGCTSVIVASHKSVWLSHLWEIPAFRRLDGGTVTFATDVLGYMGDTPGKIQGNAFNVADKVEILIISPVTFGGTTGFRFQKYVDQIQTRLGVLFPGAPIRLEAYTAGTFADMELARADTGYKGKGESDSIASFNDLFLVMIRARPLEIITAFSDLFPSYLQN